MTQLNGRLAQERMFEDAKRSVLASGEFWTVFELAKFLEVDSQTLGHRLTAWRDCGKIFSIPGGTEDDLFPRFAFEQGQGCEVREAIQQILEIFGDKLSRWAIASWFIADCSYLDDQPPKDLVEEDPDWVIEAARDEMEEISHG